MDFPIVEETTVLRATTEFLIRRGVLPYRFSVARGKGMKTQQVIESLSKKFASVGFDPQFSAHGADIEGLSDTEWWRIECKGSGTEAEGKIRAAPTHRNNFDRALASVVSYFEAPPFSLGADYNHAKLFLGLALPASPEYLRELKRRVRCPLRSQLNLWVLLYEPDVDSVKEVPPSQEF